jgi:sterol O-acyltransferase
MAETTGIDTAGQNGHGDYHQPRPRKPNHIDFLKPQLMAEEVNGSANNPASSVSR